MRQSAHLTKENSTTTTNFSSVITAKYLHVNSIVSLRECNGNVAIHATLKNMAKLSKAAFVDNKKIYMKSCRNANNLSKVEKMQSACLQAYVYTHTFTVMCMS